MNRKTATQDSSDEPDLLNNAATLSRAFNDDLVCFTFVRRFDEKLKLALAINVCGTKEILTLAKEMENLNVSCRSSEVFWRIPAVYEFA